MVRTPARQTGALALAGLILLAAWSLAACSAASTSAASANPTAFIATRVVVLLTQNALTDTAPRSPGTATPAAPTQPPAQATAAPSTKAQPGQSPAPALPTEGITLTPRPTPLNGTQASGTAGNTTPTPCGDQACAASAGHFWLERPIPEGYVNYPDRTYAFGSTADHQREPHHGVEFENSSDTPIIAAGAGKVVVAGNDHTTGYGPATDFYGNLVVVQLDQAYENKPVFNLYGHMKSVLVTVGQHVNTGQQLGVVGATGVAIGPHLHFEVRIGENDYASARNPELWLKPLRYNGLYQGAVAGRVVDTKGRLVQGFPVVLRPIAVDSDTPRSRYLTTYAADAFGLGGDAVLQENFGSTDLPLGSYIISVNTTKTYQQVINVTSGNLTWVTFVVEPPPLLPLTTPTP
jgi:murein DD-endopeptidase MepM/ murein hydrolase activator NlpD